MRNWKLSKHRQEKLVLFCELLDKDTTTEGAKAYKPQDYLESEELEDVALLEAARINLQFTLKQKTEQPRMGLKEMSQISSRR